MDWETAVYGRVLRPGDRVLLVGCGPGRDLVALLERGHAVTGLDLAPEAIAAARRNLARRGLAAPLVVAAIEDERPAGPFDAAVFSWCCYGHVAGRAARVRALAGVREALVPGGHVVVSYVPRRETPHPWLLAVARLVARATRSDWRPEPGDALTLARRPRVAHYEHRFTPAEIAAEGAEAGYEALPAAGDATRPDVAVAVLRRA
jgi:SAM-dependent methyltransferase